MRKLVVIMFAALACLAVASLAIAQDSCPVNESGNDVEAKPLAMRSYADRFGFGAAPAIYRIATIDPGGPPFTIEHPACAPDGNTVGNVAYVGSIIAGAAPPSTNGHNMTAIFVFDADDLDASANKHAMRFRNIQNFLGTGYTLQVKVLENRGDTLSSQGARGVFNRAPVAAGINTTANGAIGPQGAPEAFILATVLADARTGGGGSCSIPSLGKAGSSPGLHDSGGGLVYTTFDRDADVPLVPAEESNGYAKVRNAIRKAQSSGVEYKTCRYGCVGGPFNVDCGNPDGTGDGITVKNPIYVGVTAVHGGDVAAARRLQDTLTTDNLIHLVGDSDFCGEDAGPGTSCRVALVSKFN